jgi:two-component system nitrate/nitrite sensor histidine kinase NarX
VEDDGCGFDLAAAAEKKGSFGLKIMQERAAEIGAQFHICSRPGIGTKVILQVPLTIG